MDFDQAVAELAALVEALESAGDERSLRLLQLVDAIHRPALERIAAGESDHPLVRALLVMYELAPAGDALVAEPGMPLPQATVRRPAFVEVEGSALAPGELRAVTVDGVSVLLLNVEGELYALRNGCAVDGRPLEGGRLQGAALVCPWHNCAYDARTGRRLDEPGEARVPVVPIATDGATVRVAVGVA